MPPFSMGASTDGTRSVAERTSVQPSSEGVNASSEEGLGNPPFFWQFVKSGLDTPSCLEMVELLEAPAFSTHSSPFGWRHSLPPFLLLAGDRTRSGRHYLFRRFSYSSQENTRRKVMGRQNERTGPLGCGHLRGLFLHPSKAEEDPFAREAAAISVQVGI